MNYVRKLGFEESPDYDFLRDLFSKVLKTLGEPDDGVFDWMLLNGGKGWEAGNVSVFYCAALPRGPSSLLDVSHPQRSYRRTRVQARRRRNASVTVSTLTGVSHASRPVTRRV
jgi:casein kinase 1